MTAALVTCAAFAVWGLYCAVKLAFELWLMPEKLRPIPAVRLDGTETDEELSFLCRAAPGMWACRRGKILLIVPAGGDLAGTEARAARLGLDARVRAGEIEKTSGE